MTAQVIRLAQGHPETAGSLNEHVARRLRQRRAELRLTQEQVANAVGMSGANLSRILNGDVRLTLDLVERLYTALGIEFDGFGWTPPDDGGQRARRDSNPGPTAYMFPVQHAPVRVLRVA